MHIYIDETGQAEAGSFFGLGGIIVKNEKKNKSKDINFLKNLCKRHEINYQKIHSNKLKNKIFFNDFIAYIENNSHITPFFFGNKEHVEQMDIKNIFGKVYFQGAKYIEMLINFIEYVLFVDNSLKNNVKGLHFATRVISCQGLTEKQLNFYKNLGFGINKSKKIIYLWDKERASSLIFGLLHKYRDQAYHLNLEIIDSKTSEEHERDEQIYYKFADICANLVFRKKINKDKYDLTFYNPYFIYEFKEFDSLSSAVRAYYLKDYIEFFNKISQIKDEKLLNLLNPYLDECIYKIKNKQDIRGFGIYSFFNETLNQKQGNYTLLISVGRLLQKRLGDELPFELAESLQRAYNHIGDYKQTDKLYNYCIQILEENRTFENFFKKVEIINRHAVSLTNIFYFDKAKLQIEKVLSDIEKFKKYFSEYKIDLLGKLYGTYGQILSLLGDEQAEQYFFKAIDNFSISKDIAIQYSYLMHFYLDKGDYNKFLEYFEKIHRENFKELLIKAINNKISPYDFELILKYIYKTGEFQNYILNRWEEIYKLYESEDHPFEKIVGYLYIILEKKGKIVKKLKKYLENTGNLSQIAIELIKTYFIMKSKMNLRKKLEYLNKFIEKIKGARRDYFNIIFKDGPFCDVLENKDNIEAIELYIKKFRFYFA
jgi:hypothetical protein